jgi:prevent-host-death family protein
MQTWQLQSAKAHFSEVVRQATQEGPQEISVHGRPAAVLISRELFDQLTGSQESLVEFMRRSPLYGQDEPDFERDRSLPREDAF